MFTDRALFSVAIGRGFANRTVFLCVLALPSCRGHSASTAGGNAASSANAPSIAAPLETPSEYGTLAEAVAASDLRVEARRGIVRSSEPFFRKQSALLEAHFGAPLAYPFVYQVVSVPPGNAAVLIEAVKGDPRPLVLLIDPSGTPMWTKEHPIGGVKPGVSEASLASGPDGHVCLAWCNASTDSVALRRWAEDGGAFADYDALHVEACDKLSILYWPRHGWIIAAAGPNGAVAELVTENGGLAWGRDGLALPSSSPWPAPLAIAVDTPDTVLFFRFAQSGGPSSALYLFATRWDAGGRPIWPGPVAAKRIDGLVRSPSPRAILDPSDGDIAARLPREAFEGAGAIAVDVASDGVVRRR